PGADGRQLDFGRVVDEDDGVRIAYVHAGDVEGDAVDLERLLDDAAGRAEHGDLAAFETRAAHVRAHALDASARERELYAVGSAAGLDDEFFFLREAAF